MVQLLKFESSNCCSFIYTNRIKLVALSKLLYFQEIEKAGLISNVLNEIIQQSKVEFNYEDEL